MALLKNSKPGELERLTEENLRLKKSVEELSMLNDLARILSSTLALDQIMDKVVSASVKALGAEQGTVHLLEKAESQDQFRTLIRKADATTPEWKYRLDVVLSGWMIKNRQPLLINDFKNHKLFQGTQALDEKIRSLLSAPLICKGRLIGVLNLFNKKQGNLFSDDDQRLLSIIASQSAHVIENARLYKEEKQLRQFEQELEMARKIQRQLLPKEKPSVAGFDIAGTTHAAKVVGGDYFDFIKLKDERWAIALGDVSGKGIPAAMLMSNLQATLRNQALTTPSIRECISNANDLLYLNTESNKFVTLFYGVLDPNSKKFAYVNAGHNFPFLMNKDGAFKTLETGGVVLGMLPNCPYDKDELQLNPGDILLIYSDGVTEAENQMEQLFGEEQLQMCIRENQDRNAEQILANINQAIKAFSGPKDQDDDITMIVIKAM